MLVRYKKTYEKIAMGLLSYMPGEKNIKALQETIHQYDRSDDWQLYLWRKNDDFIGLVGIENEEDAYTIHHLSVNPSFRGEGIGREMVKRLKAHFPNKQCKSTEHTAAFLEKCLSEKEGAD